MLWRRHVNWHFNCFFQHFHFNFSVLTCKFTLPASLAAYAWTETFSTSIWTANSTSFKCEFSSARPRKMSFQIFFAVFRCFFGVAHVWFCSPASLYLHSPSGLSVSKPCLGSVVLPELISLTRSLLFIRLYLISTLLTNYKPKRTHKKKNVIGDILAILLHSAFLFLPARLGLCSFYQ